MSAVNQALRSLRASARSVQFPLDSTAEDGSRYTSAHAIIAALEPLLEAQGLDIGLPSTELENGKLVVTTEVFHCSGQTAPVRRVWPVQAGKDWPLSLAFAGASTMCLAYLYLDLCAVRPPREEAPSLTERIEKAEQRTVKVDRLAALRESLATRLRHMAEKAVPGATEMLRHVQEDANAEGLRRAREWCEKHEQITQRAAASPPAPPTGVSSPEPSMPAGGPLTGDGAPEPQAAEASTSAALAADDLGRAANEGGQGGAAALEPKGSAAAPPESAPAEKPKCERCGVEGLHVQDKQTGACLYACGLCRCKSATLYAFIGKAPKGFPRPKLFRCPDCASEQIPKGKKLQPMTSAMQPVMPSVPLPGVDGPRLNEVLAELGFTYLRVGDNGKASVFRGAEQVLGRVSAGEVWTWLRTEGLWPRAAVAASAEGGEA